MPAKTDLEDILENLHPSLVDESYVFITSKEPINVLVKILSSMTLFLIVSPEEYTLAWR